MVHNVFFFLKPKSDVEFIYSACSVQQGLEMMKQKGYTAIPVIDEEGKYVGTVKEGDFLWYVLDHPNDDYEQVDLINIVDKNYMKPVKIDTPLGELFNQSLSQNFVPIVDDRNIFIGIVTRKKIIEFLMNQQI